MRGYLLWKKIKLKITRNVLLGLKKNLTRQFFDVSNFHMGEEGREEGENNNQFHLTLSQKY